MSSISKSSKSSWMDVTNESVHTSDDVDIGDIEAINRDFIVVKRGYVNVHYYYMPMSKVEGWDGHVVWLKITEDEVKQNYEREEAPSPANYYIKDYPYEETTLFTAAYFPEMPIIKEKNSRPTFLLSQAEQARINKCALCGTTFRTDDELSKHVTSRH
jgi:hypothetical protein